ncbi:MAG TPA: oligosaccharide flippase family protein [Verrucomicrobiae bacterium]|nr:oligosaccharide flippase family protein [Verrucomicrobiae bacterium]
MSRIKRFLHILASSYVSLGAGVVFTLVSVPLALHFLPKAQFGLWALMTQAVGYVALIDAGMTGAVARHLIDHKDDPSTGDYGSVVQTGNLVWAVQGAIIFLVGFVLSPWLARLFAIPADLQHDFIVLMRWQSGIVAFAFATRVCSQIIYAHQRIDLANYVAILGFAVNLVTLWIAFERGQGVYSILWAGGISTIVSQILLFLVCWQRKMFPPWGAWGRPTWARFKQLFHYGKDVFLVMVGTQLTSASQTIIISRTLGLDMAAVWSVCTKLFLFAGELIWRVSNYAEPMFAEMMARGEDNLLRTRFRDVVTVSGTVSVFVAAGLALGNAPFVQVWTQGKMFWSPWNDVLLGIWLVTRSIIRCHVNLILISKKIGLLRFVVFAEGVLFVVLALSVSRLGGIPSVVGASILCSLFVTGNYSTRRNAQYLGYPLSQVVLGWLKGSMRLAAFLAPVALLTWWISLSFPAKWRLVWDAGILGIGGGLLWLRYGIPAELQAEVRRHLPRPCAALLAKISLKLDA